MDRLERIAEIVKGGYYSLPARDRPKAILILGASEGERWNFRARLGAMVDVFVYVPEEVNVSREELESGICPGYYCASIDELLRQLTA